MLKNCQRIICLNLWMGLLWLGFPRPVAGAENISPEAAQFFENRIRPVLADKCYSCHSADAEKLKGGLRLDTSAGLRQGGDTGKPAVVPGEPARSQLIEAIQQTNPDLKMPPKEHLSEAQVADFIAWVKLGAPDPRVEKPETQNAKSKAANHWAFQPVKAPPVPKVRDARWPQTPVDNFILAQLERHNLKPSPPADRRTLLRRVTYDLTGLPPSPAEMDAFLRDHSADANAKVVDRLLASPAYGERWGRHWLDVARYADSKGYVYAREERMFVNAHPYRDWVIRAFNEDMPYDRFLLLQLAADQVAPEDTSSLAAMGFITLGRRFLGVRHDIIDDRIDVVTRGTMGLTVQCARCHDHKYDPIPTRDYYSLYGVFQACAEELVRVRPATQEARPDPEFEKELQKRQTALQEALAARRNEATQRARARVGDYLEAQFHLNQYPEEGFDQVFTTNDVIPAFVRQWQAYLFEHTRGFDPVFAPWRAFAGLKEDEYATRALVVNAAMLQEGTLNPLVAAAFAQPPASRSELVSRYAKLFQSADEQWQAALAAAKQAGKPVPLALADPAAEALRAVFYGAHSPTLVPTDGIVDTEQFFPTAVIDALWKLQGEVERWINSSREGVPYAVVLSDRPTSSNPRVFLRGNPATKGQEIPRQFLEVVAGPNRQPFQHGSGRLELAQAIVSRDNPLTARVLVNRVWLHHFGSGLVRTPSDFGTRCEPPSHPELLDWLAGWFMDNGWSLKQLHRLLVTSSAYQQASEDGSRAQASAVRMDPENRWLGRMNRQRLDFEELRDTLLVAAGELDSRMGGKADDLFKTPFTMRRTVYGFVDRQYLPGTFRVFDFANPDMHSPERPLTSVPQQALYFLNNPFVTGRAQALVKRPEVATVSRPEDRVQALYRILYQRPATKAQVNMALRFLATCAAEPPPAPPTPIVTAWQYGFGEYDSATQRVKGFTKLPHFTGEAWQGGEAWPDAKLGWVRLTADGGHAGNDLQHAAVRRWVAPSDATVSIQSTVVHEHKAGDGIRAFLVSSRSGLLGNWTLHDSKADANVAALEVRAGDTLDFVVDINGNLNNDDFKWTPVIQVKEPAGEGEASAWSSVKEFGGPAVERLQPLTAWEKLAQVLLQANEFVFVD